LTRWAIALTIWDCRAGWGRIANWPVARAGMICGEQTRETAGATASRNAVRRQ
jgi:hypothetical protein